MNYRICSFVLLLLVASSTTAQEKGFLFTSTDTDHSWLAKDAVETKSGNFILGARNDWGNEALLLKLSPEGILLDEQILTAEDTTMLLTNVFYMPNGHYDDYVLLCPCEPNDGGTPGLIFIRFDDDLNVTLRKAVSCPFVEQGECFFSWSAIIMDSLVFVSFTVQQVDLPHQKSIVLAEMNSYGDFAHSKQLDSISSVCNLFKNRQNKISLFGNLSQSHMGILTFNESLQFVKRDSIFQWTEPEGFCGDLCRYYITDIINSQAVMLPNSSYMVSARLRESLSHANGYPYKDDQSVILAKYDSSFHQPEKMILTEHMNDSTEYPAFFRSFDYRNTEKSDCEVFQCSILNEHPQLGLLQPFPTGIVVTKADQDLNIVWKKRYLTDGNYQAMTINATSDGGCLVFGSVGDSQGQRFTLFALKINAEGFVGLDEFQEENMAFVYPNPSNGIIRISGVEADKTLIYNTLGQHVISFRGNETNVETLTRGVYLMRITDVDGKTQTLRVVITK